MLNAKNKIQQNQGFKKPAITQYEEKHCGAKTFLYAIASEI